MGSKAKGVRLLIELRCRKHPHYRGVKAPKRDCYQCEAIWVARNHPDTFQKYCFGDSLTSVELLEEKVPKIKPFHTVVGVPEKAT